MSATPQRTAPHVLVRKYLRAEWNAANTHGIAPDFRLGWLSDTAGDPVVTITEPDESPVSGGDTGFSGMDPQGGGPTQTIGGTVWADSWVRRGRSGPPSDQQLAYSMREETRRIVSKNYDAPGAADIARIAYLGSFQAPEPEDDYIRYRVQVGYGYYVHPSDW